MLVEEKSHEVGRGRLKKHWQMVVAEQEAISPAEARDVGANNLVATMVSPGPPAETGELHNAVTDSDAWWMPDNLDAPAGSTLVQTEPCCSMRQGPGWRFLQHRRVPRREVVGVRQPIARHDSTCGRRQPCRWATGDGR